MKSLAGKFIVWAVAVGFVLLAGCEEQNLTVSKRSRLIVVENVRLKEQLKRCKSEIKDHIELQKSETKKQQKLLKECQKQKKILQDRNAEEMRKQVDAVLGAVMERTAELQKENTALKAQIAELEKLKE